MKMPVSTQETAFKFAIDAGEVRSLSELESLFVQALKPFGVDFYMIGQLILPGGEIKTVRYLCADTHPWFKHYEKANLYLDDPVMRLLRIAHKPILWSELRNNRELSSAERNVFAVAADFGLKEGLSVPIHGPLGALAGVSLSGPYFRVNEDVVLALGIILNSAYQRAVEISQLFEQHSVNPLSNRQRECLNWAQYGKSNREIAEILSLSVHTVKDHMDAAMEALQVSTRIEAVIKARNANHISFSPLSDRTKPLSPD